MEKKKNYLILVTQVYGSLENEPLSYVFDNKDKAWETYKKLIKFYDKKLKSNTLTAKWVCDSDNYSDAKTCSGVWCKCLSELYNSNHIVISCDEVKFNPSYEEIITLEYA